MNRTETLQKALDVTTRRPKSYGSPGPNFERIARRWKVHLLNRYGVDVTIDAADVALMCVDLKIARLEETIDHEDSWTDLAGYAACGAEVATGLSEAELVKEAEPPSIKLSDIYADNEMPARLAR